MADIAFRRLIPPHAGFVHVAPRRFAGREIARGSHAISHHRALAALVGVEELTVSAPERSSKVLAMNRPSPSPPPGSVALAGRHVGLADAVEDFGRENPARRR